MKVIKPVLVGLAFTALSAQAFQLSPEECNNAADIAAYSARQRDQGVTLESMKENSTP